VTDEACVSVVIPAYNAAATIDETLRSVRSQTYRTLEILVIDDGSTDETADVVCARAAQDTRIRLVRQENRGVAAARNRGIEEATADLVAFVDADDLWAPDKIEKQIAALRKEGPSVALVYTWWAKIDAASRMIERYCPTDGGDVLERICSGNIVGHCSSALVTKTAVLEIGGFDPSLRARQAQGCEDLQFYFRLAERHHFAIVPEYLTGYRQTSTNMSSDLLQMRRSYALVADEMRRKYPRLESTVALGTTYFAAWVLECAIDLRRLRLIPLFGAVLVSRNPRLAARILIRRSLRRLARALRDGLWGRMHGGRPVPAEFPRFLIGDPDVDAS